MYESESSLTTELTDNQDTGTDVTPSDVTPQAGGQTTAQTPNASTGWDYKTDSRWGKVWKSEGDIINGYKSLDDVLEKKYKPTYKQYEDLKNKFKDNGIELDALDDYIKEYQTLKSPEHPANQVFNLLKELADDDITAQELDLALKDLNEKKLTRKYPGATKETREQILAQEKQLKELATWKQTLEKQEQDKKQTETAVKSLTGIRELCKSKGFDFTDDIRQEFLIHCVKNGIPEQYYAQEFRNKYDAMIDKVHEEKIKAQTLESLKKTNATTIPIKGKAPEAKPSTNSFIDRLSNAMGNRKI